MSVAPPPTRRLTVEDFLALPDDGMDRWLIRGELRPREASMSVRNRKHSATEANVTYLLRLWLEGQPEPRGVVHSGDAGFRIDPETLVGADVAFASADLVASTAENQAYYEGPPALAVEILSPSDRHEEVIEKIRSYLEVGTVVWEIDPDFRRVSVHRPGREPEVYNALGEIVGGPELPGFRVPVARFFGP